MKVLKSTKEKAKAEAARLGLGLYDLIDLAIAQVSQLDTLEGTGK